MLYIEEITQSLTWIGFFAAVFFAFYYYLKFRNRERMKLIENNADLAELYSKPRGSKETPWYMIGLTVLGIGIGVAIAFGVASITNLNGGPILFASVCIFAALGLILGHGIEKKVK
jgi:hypothetical protein